MKPASDKLLVGFLGLASLVLGVLRMYWATELATDPLFFGAVLPSLWLLILASLGLWVVPGTNLWVVMAWLVFLTAMPLGEWERLSTRVASDGVPVYEIVEAMVAIVLTVRLLTRRTTE